MVALALSLLLVGIVVEDQAPLRAAPREGAVRQAQLFRGDWLEVRGERGGYLQVYDHRRERPGYVRPYQVRSYPLEPASVPALGAVLEFLKDQPGAESLGIGYAALYLKAATPAQLGPDLFDALGTLADRLGRRASLPRAGLGAQVMAAHLDVAQSYGVRYESREGPDRTYVCYDGEAFQRLLQLGGDGRQRAQAALMLTRGPCGGEPGPLSAAPGTAAAQGDGERRLALLDQVDPGRLPAPLANRLRLRRARVLAELSFGSARRGEEPQAAARSEAAVRELALVLRGELLEEDAALYDEVAVRVGAARWPAETSPAARSLGRPRPGQPRLLIEKGEPGQTCVRLVEAPAGGKGAPGAGGKGAPGADGKGAPAAERCTYGLVWGQSARVLPRGGAVAVAVQPLPGWVELWLFRRGEGGAWSLDLLTPGQTEPEAGYVELAGWSPDGGRLLLVREAMAKGSLQREFQVLRADTLAIEQRARAPERLQAFKSWPQADWRGRTVALR